MYINNFYLLLVSVLGALPGEVAQLTFISWKKKEEKKN